MLTNILTKTWSTFWPTVRQHVDQGVVPSVHKIIIRNLLLCIICFVVKFNLFVWSPMYTLIEILCGILLGFQDPVKSWGMHRQLIAACLVSFFIGTAKKIWHMTQLAFSSNVYWNICVKICILEQIIATILFMCIFSMKNKRSMLGFQSTTAPLTEGDLPVLFVRKHPSQYFHTFPLVPTAHVAVKCKTHNYVQNSRAFLETSQQTWRILAELGGWMNFQVK